MANTNVRLSLPISEVRCSNPVIGKNLLTVMTKIKKKRLGMTHLKTFLHPSFRMTEPEEDFQKQTELQGLLDIQTFFNFLLSPLSSGLASE